MTIAPTLNINENISINRYEVRLVHSGKAYFDLLLEHIAKARQSIHLQTYIFDEDETGKMVADALKLAAKRNVSVYLLVDGYASQHLSKTFINTLEAAGVHFRFFEPFFNSGSFYFGRRLHHKLFVVDAKYALVGGINIANRYNDIDNTAAWLDFAVFVNGVVAAELYRICLRRWPVFSNKTDDDSFEEPPAMSGLQDPGRNVFVKRNDWVAHENEISSSYISMFRHAKKEITIVCSYFLPGKVIRRLLRKASQRGVKIKVVIAGPSDILVAKQAERWLYDWLLRNKIELYEYQPSVLHAKIAIADDEWMTIGSYNINDISTYASIELNLDIVNRDFVTRTKIQMEQIIQNDCKQIQKDTSRYSKNVFIQLVRWSAYQFIRIVFHLFTFYFKQKRNADKCHSR